MNVQMEDVIALLKETLEDRKKIAMMPVDNPYKQYAMIGVVEGLGMAIKKLENHFERERYSNP